MKKRFVDASLVTAAALAAAVFLFLSPCFAGGEALPLVVVVTTGGTIAEKTDPVTHASVPAVTGQDLVGAVPGLDKVARIKVREFSNIDSSRMTPQMWADLSRTVAGIAKDPEVAGVVVTHGTDTMAEGAYFVDLTLDTEKPVVFVGAMRDASSTSPDGPENILNAVVQAASPEARGWGVTITMNQCVSSALYAKKLRTTNVQTFKCGDAGYLGYIQGGRVIRYNARPRSPHLPLPEKLARVALVKTYAGDDGDFVRRAADLGYEGIVVEGLGAGNVNQAVADAIQYALDKNVVVVVTTRVPDGSVLPAYGGKGGGASLQEAGAILGGDLPPTKARLLLMAALPCSGAELEKLFQ